MSIWPGAQRADRGSHVASTLGKGSHCGLSLYHRDMAFARCRGLGESANENLYMAACLG